MSVLWCLGLGDTKARKRDDTEPERKHPSDSLPSQMTKRPLSSLNLRVFIDGKMNQISISLTHSSLSLFYSAPWLDLNLKLFMEILKYIPALRILSGQLLLVV